MPMPSRKGSLRIGAISRYANRTAPGEVARCLGWHCGHTVRSEHSGWRSGEPDLIGQLVIQPRIEINRPAIHCVVSPRC